MPQRWKGCCLSLLLGAPIPIGLDAFRFWDQWAVLRTGQRTYMRSTYDRTGGNEGADASHFLYQKADDFNVSLDVEGPGVLNFVRYNHWHGSPWHYVVDGTDRIVQETSTADPLHPAKGSVWMPAPLFPAPLAVTWADTKGADLSWVPVPFAKSFQMAYSRTRYGTGYYIFSKYVPGIELSQPIKPWDYQTPPAKDVLDLIARSGTDIAPPGLPEVTSTNQRIEIRRAPSTLRALQISVPRDRAIDFGKQRIRITWDDRSQPSVDAPVALFFGAGTLYNRDGREYLVKAFPVNIRFDKDRVHLACYFPMPFFKSAKIEITGSTPGVEMRARYAPYKGSKDQAAYFHATYRDHPEPTLGQDMVLLDTRGAEGAQAWSGHFIGTSWIFSHRAVLNTLEGDPRFFFDDSLTPQAQGTGTEEWGGGGDYWGGLNMTLPFAGHPCGAKNVKESKSELDQIESAYRFLLSDLMPFGNRAVIRLEHGGENQATEHYETVAYWYGTPRATLIETDRLLVGDAASEKAHGYVSPDAGAPYSVTSRYEWGVDHLKAVETYPAETDQGRATAGTSEFSVKVHLKNAGVMLRRKLDYQYPNQRAEVSVLQGKDWKAAGVWYLAGSNTCVYSNPKEELGATVHKAQTSNRRFRDDEFLLPLELTRGRKQVRVRVKFTPVERPLFPGHPLAEFKWSEMRYTAYSFVR